MSLPSGFVPWAEAKGINPYHPTGWTPEELAAFYAWKREWFMLKMRRFKAARMPQIMTREHLRAVIREDLERLAAPPPSRPYRVCPCHPFTPARSAPDAAPHGLAYLATFRRTVEQIRL